MKLITECHNSNSRLRVLWVCEDQLGCVVQWNGERKSLKPCHVVNLVNSFPALLVAEFGSY